MAGIPGAPAGSRRVHSSERVGQKVELSFRYLADSCLLLVDRELQLAHDLAQLLGSAEVRRGRGGSPTPGAFANSRTPIMFIPPSRRSEMLPITRSPVERLSFSPVRFDLFLIFSTTFPPTVSVAAALTIETGSIPASIPSLPRLIRFEPNDIPSPYFANVPSQVLVLTARHGTSCSWRRPAAADRSGGYSRAVWQFSMSPSASGTMRSLYLCCAMRHFRPIQRANLPPVILSAAAMVIDDGVEATVATAPATKLEVSPAPMRSPNSLVLMPMAEL